MKLCVRLIILVPAGPRPTRAITVSGPVRFRRGKGRGPYADSINPERRVMTNVACDGEAEQRQQIPLEEPPTLTRSPQMLQSFWDAASR